MRLANKELREMQKLMLSLGYRFDRTDSKGHYVYTHAAHDEIKLPCSPSDYRWKVTQLAELKRRHPDAQIFRRRKKRSPSDRRREARRKREGRSPVSLRLAPDPEPVVRTPSPRSEGFLRVRFYRCRECMKPWNDEAHFPASECPLCGCRSIDVDPPRRAAA